MHQSRDDKNNCQDSNTIDDTEHQKYRKDTLKMQKKWFLNKS